MRSTLVVLATTIAIVAGCAAPSAPSGDRVARVPLVPSDTQQPVLAPIFSGIRARGAQPLNMHRAVANAPDIFKAYFDMAIALRAKSITPRADRELLILRVATRTDARYEIAQHVPMARSCGLSQAQIDAIAIEPTSASTSALFDDKQRAILAFADGMTSRGGVDDATFARIKPFYTDQEIVELTVTGAFYGAAAQVTRTLDVHLEDDAGRAAYGAC